MCNFAGAGPVVLDGNGAGGQWERSHHQSEAGRTYNALVGELQFNTWPGWQCGHYEGAGTACPAQGRQVPHAVLGSPRAWADAYPKCQLMPREQTFRCFVAGDLQAVKPVDFVDAMPEVVPCCNNHVRPARVRDNLPPHASACYTYAAWRVSCAR